MGGRGFHQSSLDRLDDLAGRTPQPMFYLESGLPGRDLDVPRVFGFVTGLDVRHAAPPQVFITIVLAGTDRVDRSSWCTWTQTPFRAT